MGNIMIMSISLRYEELAPGPIGEKLAVIDYDGTNKTYYKPVDLADPRRLGPMAKVFDTSSKLCIDYNF
jgi:hypothetical protein